VVNGVQSGTYTEWWPSGERRGEGPVQAGLREGEWIFWDRKGVVDASLSGKYEAGKKVL
jgi:antitoxin component YwqK of YwqJK toxin-antitoxin module